MHFWTLLAGATLAVIGEGTYICKGNSCFQVATITSAKSQRTNTVAPQSGLIDMSLAKQAAMLEALCSKAGLTVDTWTKLRGDDLLQISSSLSVHKPMRMRALMMAARLYGVIYSKVDDSKSLDSITSRFEAAKRHCFDLLNSFAGIEAYIDSTSPNWDTPISSSLCVDLVKRAPLWAMDLVAPKELTDVPIATSLLKHKVFAVRRFLAIRPTKPVLVRTDYILNDTGRALMGIPSREVGLLSIRYDGIDWGKDFWYEMIDSGLLISDRPGHAVARLTGAQSSSRVLEAAGRLLAYQLLNNIPMENIYFPLAYYAYLIGQPFSLSMIRDDYPTIYKHCKVVLDTDLDRFYAQVGMKFKFTVPTVSGIKELVEGGSRLVVDETNKKEYVKKLVEYHIIGQSNNGLVLVKNGFQDVMKSIDVSLKWFGAEAVRDVLVKPASIKKSKFKAHMQYDGFKNVEKSRRVQWFWNEVKQWDAAKMERLVELMTGSGQVPIGGFRFMRSGYRLVACDDCSLTADLEHNALKLPRFATEEEMASRLRALVTA